MNTDVINVVMLNIIMGNKTRILNGMKLKIIKYDGTEIFLDVLSFEFRTNHVSNWIKVKTIFGDIIYIHDVCVIKNIE